MAQYLVSFCSPDFDMRCLHWSVGDFLPTAKWDDAGDESWQITRLSTPLLQKKVKGGKHACTISWATTLVKYHA